jgi:hypothetical protein
MNVRQTSKRILYFVLLPVFVAVVAGYTVDRIKGTPPSEIAAALWQPFGASIDGTSAWFRGPVQMTHLSALLLLTVLAWLVYAVARLRYRVNRMGGRSFFSNLGDLTDQITHLQELRRKVDGRLPVPPAQVIEGFEPSRIQQIAARILIDRYPNRLQLPDLAAAMQKLSSGVVSMPVAPQGEIARQMEEMEQKGVATIDDPTSIVAYYGLTRHGRDFMLENLKAPRFAQHAADSRRSPLRSLDDEPKR